MKRGAVKEMIKFTTRASLQSLKNGERCSAIHEDQMVHMQVSYKDDLIFCAFTTIDYPKRVAYQYLKEAIDLFEASVGESWKAVDKDENLPVEGWPELFTAYKTASNDQLTQAQMKIDETQDILVSNMRELLERQGNLDELVQQSDDLSNHTKVFYKNSKKMNKKCCNLI
jgi:synaptobrevin family protein YKT6